MRKTYPLFQAAGTGRWTSAGSYNPDAGQTLLADTSASWQANELAGRTVNPQVSQFLQFSVASNDATTIMIWGNAAALAASNAPYRIDNYRLSSASPCVNAGANQEGMAAAADLDGRPRPDGFFRRVDLGAYEYMLKGAVFLFR